MRTATRLLLTVLLLFALPFGAIAAQQTILSTGTTWGTEAGKINSNLNELYGRKALPTSCSNTNTVQYNTSTGLFECVAWDTLAADDITLYIENGIMSVKANVFQAVDADLTTAAGASAAGNSKYFGTNATGTAGFYSLPTGGGISSVSSDPSLPSAGDAWYNTTDHTLNVAQASGSTKFSGTYTAWDTTPSAFSFTDETDIAINTAKASNAITVAGINYTTPVSVTGSTGYGYKKNGGACTATTGSVVVGDTIAACVTSSGSNSTATTATVDIGGVTDTYSVTTVAPSGGDPEFVQITSQYAGTGAVSSLTLGSAVTGGNQLIAIFQDHSTIDGEGASISGGCATTWTAYAQNVTGSNAQKIFYCSNASSGSNAVTPSSWSVGDKAWYLMEVANTGAREDSSLALTSASTAVDSGLATATGKALMIGSFDTSGSLSISSVGSGWTQRAIQSSHRSVIYTKVVTSGGDYGFTATLGTSTTGVGFIQIFGEL